MKRRPEVGGRLPSLSLDQLAKRWAWEESDVADAILTGVLRAHLLLNGFSGTVGAGITARLVQRSGHYLLPVESAAEVFGLGAVGFGENVQVVLDEAGTRANLGNSLLGVDRRHIRVLTEEIERFETDAIDSAPTPELRASGRESVRHRERCRTLAAYLWRQTPSLTIEDMIRTPELQEIALVGQTYGDKTLRDWIKDLCPDRSPGRRKSPVK